jgi:mannonate dehydratase
VKRRDVLKTIGAPALAGSLPAGSGAAEPKFSRMPGEGNHTPKICLGVPGTVDEPGMRRLKQIGVDHVLTGGPRIPWNEGDLRARIARFQAGGLTLCNLMISGFDDVIWGRPGADAQTADVVASIRAAGKAGLPVVEYNFYGHRLIEGYKEEAGRAGAGYTAYDYGLSRNLPPREGVGTHTRAEQLERARRFLKAVVP